MTGASTRSGRGGPAPQDTRGTSGPDAVLVTSVELTAGDPPPSTVVDAVVAAVGSALAAQPGPDRHVGAWVLVRSHGRPVATLELPLPLRRSDVAGHPGLAGTLEPPPAPRDRTLPLPSLSVVVPTVVERVADLDRCLSTLEAADYPSAVELLLVDNRPVVPADDPLPDLLARHPRVRRVHAPRPGISHARNAGLAAARGDVVAFTDDDVRVDPGWLLALGGRFAAHPEEDVVTGLVVPAELQTPAQRAYEAHYGGFGGARRVTPAQVGPVPGRPGRVAEFDAAGDPVREFPVYGVGAFGAGANMAFRRTALPGGFDVCLGTGTPARGGEDLAALVEVLWRGGRLGYEPAAVVHHTHRRDLPGLERQLHGNGVGFTAMLTALVRRDPRHLRALASLVPAAAVAKVRWALARAGSAGSPAAPPVATATAPPVPGVNARRLVLLELRGMPWGPVAYARSRMAARSTSARPTTTLRPQEIS